MPCSAENHSYVDWRHRAYAFDHNLRHNYKQATDPTQSSVTHSAPLTKKDTVSLPGSEEEIDSEENKSSGTSLDEDHVDNAATSAGSHVGHGKIDDGKKFKYEPLDSNSRCIRLLEVLPGDSTEAIRCDLREVSLEDEPSYIALSYTWDREKESKDIQLKGEALRIGRNLWNFLLRFRGKNDKTPALLWIDALCIDQMNIRERNHQVGQMRDIYAGADSVIVWLGDDVDDATTHLAFDLVDGPKRLELRNGQDLRYSRSKKQWKAFQTILNEPYYWSRVWIIQEFILAKSIEIWCGARSTQLDNLEQLCRCIARFEKPTTPNAATGGILKTRGWTLSKHRSQWPRIANNGPTPSTFGLQKLLGTYAKSQSTDIRDRVYALLGLACDASQSQYPIVVDYAKSNVEVLVDVIRNQCQWSSLSETAASYKFVGSLCELLEVSAAALSFHVIQHVPQFQKHINIVATEAHAQVPLRSIGTILDTASLDNAHGEAVHRPVLNWPLEWRSDGKHRYQSNSVSVRLVDNMNDADTSSFMDTDFSELYADELDPPTSIADGSNPLPTSITSGPYYNTECVTFDDKKWLWNVQDASRNHGTFGTKDNHSNAKGTMGSPDNLNVFVGTENLIGITSCSIQNGDVVCVACGDEYRKSAIIMRRSTDSWKWTTIGIAIIPDKSYSPMDDPPKKAPSPNGGLIDDMPGTDRSSMTGDDEMTGEASKDSPRVPENSWDGRTDDLIVVGFNLGKEKRPGGPCSRVSIRRGFTIFRDLNSERSTWKVRPNEGNRFCPRSRRPGKAKYLRLFCPPTCLPQLARIGLVRQVYIPRYSGFRQNLRGGEGGAIVSGSDKTSGEAGDKDAIMDRRAGCYELKASPPDHHSDRTSVASHIGAIPLPTFTHKNTPSTSRSGLILPNSRPDWPIPNPARRFDE